jgi:hypothetical protein
MLSLFVEAPVAPSAIVTVPDETVWLADVELVKVANVPRPAMLAAAPSTASDASSLRVGDQVERGRGVRFISGSPVFVCRMDKRN